MSNITSSGIKSVLSEGLIKSVTSLMVKVGAAGLTYAMLVTLSRTMDATQYGLFAFGFSLATVLAIGASMGQQIAILRFWPEEQGRDAPEEALSALQSGWALTIMAGLVIGLVLAAGALGFGAAGGVPGQYLHVVAASLLVLPLAMAEYGSSALRAQGSVVVALLPRDILWRLSVPLVAWVLFYFGIRLSGVWGLVLVSGLLALMMALQFFLARVMHLENSVSFNSVKSYWRKRGAASRWFLVSTVLDSAALNMDVVLVGLFLAAQSAGLYFNAFRTAGLITLFMFAITIVIAPMISRYFHSGEMRKAQAITTLCSWAGFLFSLAVFVLFWFYGDLILTLFGETYAEGWIVLILLSIGLLADAATGPTRIVMMMTGRERDYVRIFGAIFAVGFVVQLIAIPLYGIVAAAAVNMVARIIGQFAIAVWTKRHVGLDTSLFGLLDLRKSMPKAQ